MKVALAILCVGAVTFLLRFLFALVKEGLRVPPSALRVYLAKFHPSGPRGELKVMNLERQKQQFSKRNGERIAILALVAAGLVLPQDGQQSSGGPSVNEMNPAVKF